MDGQLEHMNTIIEEYLRAYINYQQDNWVALLPMCEFAVHNSFSESTKFSPFLANYGYHPRFLDVLAPQDKYPVVPWASSLATELVDLHSTL